MIFEREVAYTIYSSDDLIRMLKLQLFRESDREVMQAEILYMLFYGRKVIYMIGVIVNTVAVLIGSGLGLLLKKGIPEKWTDLIMKGIGL